MDENNFVTSACGARDPGILCGTAWKQMPPEDLVTKAIRHAFRDIDTELPPHDPCIDKDDNHRHFDGGRTETKVQLKAGKQKK